MAFFPTAETQPAGTVFVSDYEFFVLQVGYAPVDEMQASVTLTPHPKLGFTGTYAYTATDVVGGPAAAPPTSEQQGVEGTVSVSPIQATSGSV